MYGIERMEIEIYESRNRRMEDTWLVRCLETDSIDTSFKQTTSCLIVSGHN